MQKALRPSSLVPAGVAVTGAASAGEATTAEVCSTSATSRCPGCGVASRRVHSRYRRRIVDLPMVGRFVELVATVRRFRCEAGAEQNQATEIVDTDTGEMTST